MVLLCERPAYVPRVATPRQPHKSGSKKPKGSFDPAVRASNSRETKRERIELRILTLFKNQHVEYEHKVVRFRTIKGGRQNGQFGWRTPTFRLTAGRGLVFVEFCEKTNADLDGAHAFIKKHYGISVLLLTSSMLSQLERDPDWLFELIDEKVAEQSRNRRLDEFEPDILAAAKATLEWRSGQRRKNVATNGEKGTPAQTVTKPPRRRPPNPRAILNTKRTIFSRP